MVSVAFPCFFNGKSRCRTQCLNRSNRNVLPKRIPTEMLVEIKTATRLVETQIYALYSRFRHLAPNGELNLSGFQRAMGYLSTLDHSFLCNRMFAAFDTSGNGSLTFVEFAIALGIMIAGTDDEKLTLAYRILLGPLKCPDPWLCDSLSSHSVTHPTCSRGNEYQTQGIPFSVFKKIIFSIQTSRKELLGWFPDYIEETTMRRIFDNVATARHGSERVLSLDDFKHAIAMNEAFLSLFLTTLGPQDRKPSTVLTDENVLSDEKFSQKRFFSVRRSSTFRCTPSPCRRSSDIGPMSVSVLSSRRKSVPKYASAQSLRRFFFRRAYENHSTLPISSTLPEYDPFYSTFAPHLAHFHSSNDVRIDTFRKSEVFSCGKAIELASSGNTFHQPNSFGFGTRISFIPSMIPFRNSDATFSNFRCKAQRSGFCVDRLFSNKQRSAIQSSPSLNLSLKKSFNVNCSNAVESPRSRFRSSSGCLLHHASVHKDAFNLITQPNLLTIETGPLGSSSVASDIGSVTSDQGSLKVLRTSSPSGFYENQNAPKTSQSKEIAKSINRISIKRRISNYICHKFFKSCVPHGTFSFSYVSPSEINVSRLTSRHESLNFGRSSNFCNSNEINEKLHRCSSSRSLPSLTYLMFNNEPLNKPCRVSSEISLMEFFQRNKRKSDLAIECGVIRHKTVIPTQAISGSDLPRRNDFSSFAKRTPNGYLFSSRMYMNRPNFRRERKRQGSIAQLQQRIQRCRPEYKLFSPNKGFAVYFGHRSWNTVLNMMIGICLAGRLSNRQKPQSIKPCDFLIKAHINITSHVKSRSNPENSSFACCVSAVCFIDYAPVVFSKIRDFFGLNSEEYFQSLGPEQIIGNMMLGNLSSLSELCTEGQSGAFFYYSADGKYLVKTITSGASRFLRKILKDYYHHITSHTDTLITRFYGFHAIYKKTNKSISPKLYFIIMNNVFHTPVALDRRYDLKGSWEGRAIDEMSKKNPSIALKDNDMVNRGEKIRIGPECREILLNTIQTDIRFFSQHSILDYSLVVGIHEIRKEMWSCDNTPFYPFESQSLVKVQSNQAPSLVKPFHQRYLGGIISSDGKTLYYLGIIDILTSWTLFKKIERGYKVLQKRGSGAGISCAHPNFYARRFIAFMENRIE